MHSAQQLRNFAGMSEGIEYRVRSAAEQAHSLEELILSIKSKRYTYARISRMLMSVFIGLTAGGDCACKRSAAVCARAGCAEGKQGAAFAALQTFVGSGGHLRAGFSSNGSRRLASAGDLCNGYPCGALYAAAEGLRG